MLNAPGCPAQPKGPLMSRPSLAVRTGALLFASLIACTALAQTEPPLEPPLNPPIFGPTNIRVGQSFYMAIPTGGCYIAAAPNIVTRAGNTFSVYLRVHDVRNGVPIPICNVQPGRAEFSLPFSETGSYEVRLFARTTSANLILFDYLQGTRTVTVSEAVAVPMNSPIAVTLLVFSLAVAGARYAKFHS